MFVRHVKQKIKVCWNEEVFIGISLFDQAQFHLLDLALDDRVHFDQVDRVLKVLAAHDQRRVHQKLILQKKKKSFFLIRYNETIIIPVQIKCLTDYNIRMSFDQTYA